ncbi:hypothetical protein ACFQ0B_72930 [Nonomuraea thailandensis]
MDGAEEGAQRPGEARRVEVAVPVLVEGVPGSLRYAIVPVSSSAKTTSGTGSGDSSLTAARRATSCRLASGSATLLRRTSSSSLTSYTKLSRPWPSRLMERTR